MKLHRIRLECTAIALLLGCTEVYAGVIGTRHDLNGLLGNRAVTEDFEGLNVPNGAIFFISDPLNSTSVKYGQGPGLVVPGVDISYPSPGNGFLMWIGAGYLGQPSQDLGPNGTAGALVLDFDPPTAAFGLDLLAFAGFPSPAGVEILAPDRSTVLFSTTVNVIDPAMPVFFGFADPGGIGRVRLAGSEQSPLIDDLTFGAVPEPSTFVLIVSVGFLLARSLRTDYS
ncbi:MAG: hypothetical protein WD851_00785 [Pirellulales bacterium]